MELPFAESYKIKMVEPIRKSTRQEREKWIKDADYNLFGLKSDMVFIDLLTDSGTGAMSDRQWSEIMLGDESYAGASSYFKMKEAIQEVLGFDTVNKCDIVFDKYLSITDYHLAKTGMNWKETGWWTDNEIWDATKGKYCEDKFIELVFDDTLRYWKYMPLYTRFMYVKKGMTVETVNAFIREIDLWIPTIHNPIYYKERYL